MKSFKEKVELVLSGKDHFKLPFDLVRVMSVKPTSWLGVRGGRVHRGLVLVLPRKDVKCACVTQILLKGIQ